MPCCIPYLLRTQAQIDAFRESHGELIRVKSDPMASWFNGLPLYQWVRLQCRPGEEAATVGLLCILYLDGRINISFSRDGEYIRREALDPEEYQAWTTQRYKR